MAEERSGRSLGRVIFWRYPRGSWQYDILCLLILAFIFLTPRGVFDGSYFDDARQETDHAATVDQGRQSAGSHHVDEEPSRDNPDRH